MKKFLVILTLLLMGCAQNPADKAPHATVGTPAAQPAATAPADPGATPALGATPATVAGTRYAFDPQTSKVEWVGSKVTRSHNGGFRSFSGEIGLVEDDPTKSSVHVDIQADSIFADDPKLTEHLKSPDFFDVKQFPTASFHSTSITKKGEGYEMSGDLQMHGVTRTVTFPAQITVAPDGVTAKAEFAINRKDWGIVYAGMADDLIRDEVVMKLDIVARPAGDAAGAGASPAAAGDMASPEPGGDMASPEPGGDMASPAAGDEGGAPATDASPTTH